MNHQAREHFKITTCTNPKHNFRFGKLIGQWQIANDMWVNITDGGNEITHWIRLGKFRDQDNAIIYELVIWKLSVIWGFVD